MWKLWPTKKQYLSWSMPTKLSFISTYIGFFTLIASTLSSAFSYLSYSKDEKPSIQYVINHDEDKFISRINLEENGHSKLVYTDEDSILDFIRTEDFDLDGYKDLLFSSFCGGNGCPTDYIILLNKGDGYIKTLKNDDFWSWQDPEISFINNRWIFRVTQYSLGVGNTSQDQHRVTLEINKGQLEVVEKLDINARPKVKALKELSSKYFTDNPSKTDDKLLLKFDLNSNGIEDEIICGYWERWGDLICDAKLDHKTTSISVGCNRIGVTEQVHDGYHSLVCGIDDILTYNHESNHYELINESED